MEIVTVIGSIISGIIGIAKLLIQQRGNKKAREFELNKEAILKEQKLLPQLKNKTQDFYQYLMEESVENLKKDYFGCLSELNKFFQENETYFGKTTQKYFMDFIKETTKYVDNLDLEKPYQKRLIYLDPVSNSFYSLKQHIEYKIKQITN